MSIKIIAAIEKNNGLGYGNDLLFHIPDDLKRFKHLTENHYVVMGSNTYRSLPVNKLPNRVNVVLSRRGNVPTPSDVFVMDSLEHAVNHYNSGDQTKDMWIIGGQSVYEEALNYADEVYLTFIDKAADKVDTFFNRNKLEEDYYISDFKKNYCEKNDLNFYYVHYRHKKHYIHRWDELKK